CIFLAKYPLQQFLNDRGGYFRNIYFFCFQDNLSRIFKFTILETFLFVFVHDRRKFMRRLQFVSVCPRQFNCIRVWSCAGQLRVPYFRQA
ncbi:unnamed protein product, partial [Tenebrio molitor]